MFQTNNKKVKNNKVRTTTSGWIQQAHTKVQAPLDQLTGIPALVGFNYLLIFSTNYLINIEGKLKKE